MGFPTALSMNLVSYRDQIFNTYIFTIDSGHDCWVGSFVPSVEIKRLGSWLRWGHDEWRPWLDSLGFFGNYDCGQCHLPRTGHPRILSASSQTSEKEK